MDTKSLASDNSAAWRRPTWVLLGKCRGQRQLTTSTQRLHKTILLREGPCSPISESIRYQHFRDLWTWVLAYGLRSSGITVSDKPVDNSAGCVVQVHGLLYWLYAW